MSFTETALERVTLHPLTTHFIFPTPTCDGYNFKGWYKNPELTISANEQELLSNSCDVTLYAKWIKTSAVYSRWNSIQITEQAKMLMISLFVASKITAICSGNLCSQQATEGC